MTPWYIYAWVVYLAIECICQIATIGRPRAPRSPFDAITNIAVFALLGWTIVSLAS